MRPSFIDELSAQISQRLQAQAGDTGWLAQSREELQQSVRIVLESTLQRLNLVSREEFDAQCAVLERTRQRLEVLEQELKALEAQLKP